MNTSIPPSAPPAASTPIAPLSSSPQGPQAEILTSQAETMIGWIKADLAAGKMSPEAANKALDQLNASPEQRGPDTRTDEQKQLDKTFPPAKESDYTIRYGEPGQEPVMTPELKEFDTTARAWLSGAEFPRDLGNSLIAAVSRVAQHTKDMNEAQLEQYGFAEFAKLEQAHGPALQEKLQAAAR